MSHHLPAGIWEAADTALANRHGRPFINAVRAFSSALQRIPDGSLSDYSHGALAVVRDLAEQVIAEIEDRLDDRDDSRKIQEELARTVYAIRRALEEIYLWERHFSRDHLRAAAR